MGDVIDFYRDTKEIRLEASRERKERNLNYAKIYLTKNNIPYEVMSNGIHFVVDSRIDFWPTTGKWIERKSKRKGRGITSLIDIVKQVR